MARVKRTSVVRPRLVLRKKRPAFTLTKRKIILRCRMASARRGKGIHWDEPSEEDMTILFRRYQRVAMKLAGQFSGKWGRSQSEMVEKAIDALADVVVENSYLPSIGTKPVTWFYSKIYWSLHDYCWKKAQSPEVPLRDGFDQEEEAGWLSVLLKELSEEGKALVNIVCEAPGELAHVLWFLPKKGSVVGPKPMWAPKKQRRKLKQYLRDNRWSEEKIERAWEEVQKCIGG